MNDADKQPLVVVPAENGKGCKGSRSWRRLFITALSVISLVSVVWIMYGRGEPSDKAWEFLADYIWFTGGSVLIYIGADTWQKVKAGK